MQEGDSEFDGWRQVLVFSPRYEAEGFVTHPCW